MDSKLWSKQDLYMSLCTPETTHKNNGCQKFLHWLFEPKLAVSMIQSRDLLYNLTGHSTLSQKKKKWTATIKTMDTYHKLQPELSTLWGQDAQCYRLASVFVHPW